ncbi:MAG: acyltransferase family protein, partial [Chthoniobacterales bacterium]
LYLVYPFFLLLCRRWGIGKFLLVVAVADISLRALGVPESSKEGWLFSQLPFFYWLTWGAGAWCAERAWSGQPLFPGERLVALALFVAAVLTKVYQPLTWLSAPLVSAAFALLCDVYGRRSGALSVSERIAVPLGVVSYSFYLIHQPIIVQLFPRLEARLFGGNVWLTATIGGLLMFTVIFVLSAIMYRWVEQRSNEVGHRLATRG